MERRGADEEEEEVVEEEEDEEVATAGIGPSMIVGDQRTCRL